MSNMNLYVTLREAGLPKNQENAIQNIIDKNSPHNFNLVVKIRKL